MFLSFSSPHIGPQVPWSKHVKTMGMVRKNPRGKNFVTVRGYSEKNPSVSQFAIPFTRMTPTEISSSAYKSKSVQLKEFYNHICNLYIKPICKVRPTVSWFTNHINSSYIPQPTQQLTKLFKRQLSYRKQSLTAHKPAAGSPRFRCCVLKALRVECPSTACAYADTSRVKVVQRMVGDPEVPEALRPFHGFPARISVKDMGFLTGISTGKYQPFFFKAPVYSRTEMGPKKIQKFVKFNSKIVVNCKLLFYLFWDILIYDIFY